MRAKPLVVADCPFGFFQTGRVRARQQAKKTIKGDITPGSVNVSGPIALDWGARRRRRAAQFVRPLPWPEYDSTRADSRGLLLEKESVLLTWLCVSATGRQNASCKAFSVASEGRTRKNKWELSFFFPG